MYDKVLVANSLSQIQSLLHTITERKESINAVDE